MNASTRQLRALLQIARLRSFTRAAEQLHVTQAGLSAMIRDLEAQVGCRLFDRTTRSVTLTAAGTLLLSASERMLAEFDTTIAGIGEATSSSRRMLTIAATPFISSSLLPSACIRFGQLRPDVSVRIKDCVHDQVRDLVETGECDLGFGVFFKSASGIERVPIFDFDLVLVSRADKAMRESSLRTLGQQAIPWSALKDQVLIGMPAENPIQRLVDVNLRKIGRENEDRPFYNNFHTLLSMIEAGFGTSVLPSFVGGAASGRRLRLQLINKPQVSLSLFRVSKKGRDQAESADDFVKCLVGAITDRWSEA